MVCSKDLRAVRGLATWLVALLLLILVPQSVVSQESTSPAQEALHPLVLAHYMPWYAANAQQNQWGWHWTMNHFDPASRVDGRRSIASHYYPLIGPYDSADPHVIEYHLLTMRAAGIDGIIIDWYGRESFRDYVQLHTATTRVIEKAEELGIQFLICYEDQTIGALVEAGRLPADQRVAHAVNDLRWLDEHWFPLSGYIKLDGKPVLLSFGQDGLTDEQWTECLTTASIELNYVSLHHRRTAAVGAYDWPLPDQGVEAIERFARDSQAWQLAIPVAFPRFVDIYQQARVHESWGTIQDRDGDTWTRTLERALQAETPMIQLATWNDWGEGTQIEPSIEFGFRDLEVLQRQRRSWDPDYREATAIDLRIPLQLYAARQQQASAQDKQRNDSVAQAIVDRAWKDARRRSISLPKVSFTEPLD